MGTDDEVGLVVEDFTAGKLLFRVVERAGEQGDAVPLAGALEDFAGGEVVLCGENFRRRHESCLVAVFNGNQHGLEGHDGFAGADVALEKSSHGRWLAHVSDDFGEGAFLCTRGMEGQDLPDGLAYPVVGLKSKTRAQLKAAAFEVESKLEIEEFLKRQAPVRRCGRSLKLRHGGAGRRKVGSADGGFARGQAETFEHRGRKSFGDLSAKLFEEVVDGAADPAGREPAAPERLVDGRDAADFEQVGFIIGIVGQDFKLWLDHFEITRGAGRLHLAVERDHLAGFEFAFKVGTVEPEAFHGGGSLAYGHFKDRHGAGAQQRGAADFGDDGGHLSGHKFVECARVQAVFVAEGQMEEQVLHGEDALFFQCRRDLRTDAFNELHGGVELEHISDRINYELSSGG